MTFSLFVSSAIEERFYVMLAAFSSSPLQNNEGGAFKVDGDALLSACTKIDKSDPT